MNLLSLSILLSFNYLVNCQTQPPSIGNENIEEDQKFLHDTITQYGPPADYIKLGLPGPEIYADRAKYLLSDVLTGGELGTYSFRLRTFTDYFSYNGRYEEAMLKRISGQESPVIKGQFGEHFKRKSGGYYIRTVGYTLDENGYRQFLVDISTAIVTVRQEAAPVPVSDIVGGAGGGKVPISTTVLATLTGGNIG
ncbi:uncharacterized protein [Tenebrio molitor]|uniref:uncharacterized protein n=1 Tax=Tenebrio molitor TaxID=7067 RepID=UPI0036247144